MLPPFLLSSLFPSAIIIFVVTATVSLRMTRMPAVSLLAALFKTGLFLFYFGYFFDGTFTFKDDLSYLKEAQLYDASHVTVLNFYQHWPLILSTAGNHFVYQLFCTFALQFLGPGYFAPVALNTALTAVIAALGCKIAEQEFAMVGPWRNLAFFALLLDPSITVWAGFINGKDILVLLGHVAMLYGFMLLYRGKVIRSAVILVPAGLILFFLRFYVPLLFAAVFGLSIFLGAGRRRLGRMILLSIAGLAVLLAAIGPGTLLGIVDRLRNDFVNPLYGLPRFLLTPIPFNTDPDFRFIEIPSLLNWLLMPLMLWGAFLAARPKTPFSKFFLIYCVVFVALYSTYAELQEPRHRLQLQFAAVVLELLAFRALLGAALSSGRPGRTAGGPVAFPP